MRDFTATDRRGSMNDGGVEETLLHSASPDTYLSTTTLYAAGKQGQRKRSESGRLPKAEKMATINLTTIHITNNDAK